MSMLSFRLILSGRWFETSRLAARGIHFTVARVPAAAAESPTITGRPSNRCRPITSTSGKLFMTLKKLFFVCILLMNEHMHGGGLYGVCVYSLKSRPYHTRKVYKNRMIKLDNVQFLFF